MNGISIVVTALAAFLATAALTGALIPMLKRLKFGQSIREDGPTWHKDKQGTPTMGGIAIIIGVVVAALIGYFSLAMFNVKISFDETVKLFAGLIMAVLFGLVGFIDDYIKVVKKRNLGLKAGQKIILQILATALFLTALYIFGDKSTVINIPFIGSFDFGFFYYPIMGILIIGIVNSANLTDGIDGLLSSVSFVVGIFFMIAAGYMGLIGMNILATALSAACIGFLMFNAHPAKVFMGDTGSMFLGGVATALGFGIDLEFILLIAGFIYCFESLSVILQVISVKLTGKRLFKMSPIHHHFELMGWKENKIVITFSAAAAVCCVIAFIAILL